MAPKAVPTQEQPPIAERRSRLFGRLCPRRSIPKIQFPSKPKVLAGAFGGPFCIFLLTPVRNALTLASQDVVATPLELYKRVFQDGFFRGWTGGFVTVGPACPQFIMMGPLFHLVKDTLGSAAVAVVIASIIETTISFGSQTVNAQMAYNQEQLAMGGSPVPLWSPFNPYGPGMTPHVLRNMINMSGIRILAGPCGRTLAWFYRKTGLRVTPHMQDVLADFVASICSACLSAPMNQIYNYAVTSDTYAAASTVGKFEEIMGFIGDCYLLRGEAGNVIGISPVLLRDLFMRCAYVATLMTMFSGCERLMQALWQWKEKRAKADSGPGV